MTFASSLPAIERPAESAEPFRIVLVEDNEDDVLILRRAIAASGEAVVLHRAADGAEAFDSVSRRAFPGLREQETPWPPDLIIVDLALPGLSGFAVIERLRGEPSLDYTPVVVLSGTDNPRDQDRSLELGVHTHLRKPIRPRELAWMVESIRGYRSRIGRLDALAMAEAA